MQAAPLMGGIFFLLWLLKMAAMVAGYVILLVALWRGMKAHERIATTLDTLARNLPSQKPI